MSDYSQSDDDELLQIIREETAKEGEQHETETVISPHSVSVIDEEISHNEEEDTEKITTKSRKRSKFARNGDFEPKTEKEKQLRKLVFGDKDSLIENLKNSTEVSKIQEEEDNSDDTNDDLPKPKRKPVWHDSDDETYHVGDVYKKSKRNGLAMMKDKTYKQHLTSKFHSIQAPPKWADLDREQEPADSDEEILQTVGHLKKSTSSLLPANILGFKRLKDLNRETYGEGGITAVQFHPHSTVALVTGIFGVASIYSIDGLKNEKLHNVRFKNFPIKCAKITPSGTEAFIGGSKNYYYNYDLMKGQETRIFLPKTITRISKFEISQCGKYIGVAGRFGEVHLMDLRSQELIHTFKQEEKCCDLQFTSDSKKIITRSNDAEITIFDIRQSRAEHIFTDDGCIHGSTISLSPNGKLLATGSGEGVVNIYNYESIFASKIPQPEKTVYNLSTYISYTKFNNTSEALALCSSKVADALKVVHFPSGTAFSNFPGHQANLGHCNLVEFSPGSGFMAVGNARREVRLIRLKHFNNY